MCMKDVKENRVNNLVIGNVKLDGNLILAPMYALQRTGSIPCIY